MKHLHIIKTALFTLAITTLSCKVSAQEKFHIDGTVTGLSEGNIYAYMNGGTQPIEVKNGRFQIDSVMNEPVFYLFFMKNAKMDYTNESASVSVYVEPGSQTLKMDYSDFRKSVLSGSKTQDDNYRYKAITDRIKKKYKKVYDKYDALSKKYKDAAVQKKDEETLDKIKYEINDVKELLEPAYKEITMAALKFIKDHPQSYFSLNLMPFYLKELGYNEAKAYYDNLNPLYKNTGAVKRLADEIEKMKKGIPGALAGPFNTKDIHGNPIKLDDFKGKYLLIDFWASWCVPCRKGNPHLLKLYTAYKPKGLEILGVASDDRNEDKWKQAVEKDGIGVWRHVLRGLQFKKETYERINIEQDISEGYNIHTLPTKILVGPDGKIIARYDNGEADDEKMDKDLASIFGAE